MSLFEVAPLSAVIERLSDLGRLSIGDIKLQLNPRRMYALSDIHIIPIDDKRLISCQLVHVDAYATYQPASHATYRSWCKQYGLKDLFDKKLGAKKAQVTFVHHSVYGSFQCEAVLQILDRVKRRIHIHELSTLPAITRSSRSG